MNWRKVLSWEVYGPEVGDRVYCNVASLGPQHHATITWIKQEDNGPWIKLTFDNPTIQHRMGDYLFWHENVIPLFPA
jgi:hypothetical protein